MPPQVISFFNDISVHARAESQKAISFVVEVLLLHLRELAMNGLQKGVNVTLHSTWILFALELNADRQVWVIFPISLEALPVVVATLPKVVVKFCVDNGKTHGKFAAGLSVMDRTNLAVIADPRVASSKVCQRDLVVYPVAYSFVTLKTTNSASKVRYCDLISYLMVRSLYLVLCD